MSIQLPNAHPLTHPDGAEDRVQIIHPAFELREDLLLLSFTEKYVSGGAPASRIVRVVSTRDGVRLLDEADTTIQVDGHTYVLDNRFSALPELNREWSRRDLDRFAAHPTALPGRELYERLVGAIHRHIDLDERGAYVILATWPLLSFIFTAFPAIPFLLLLGPKATGKTQALEVLSKLCRCGFKAHTTGAALGDMIQTHRASCFSDQANQLEAGLLQILIDSYKAGACRIITNMDDRGNPLRFETFSPKAFAAHKEFNDDLADRCIPFSFAPATGNPERLLASDECLDEVRRELYRFALVNGHRVFTTPAFQNSDEVAARLGFSARAWELWSVMEAIFELLDVPEEDRDAARAFYRASIPTVKAELGSVEHALLSVLLDEAKDGSASVVVRSDLLTGRVNTAAGELVPIDEARLGKVLRDMSLLQAGGRRIRAGKRRVSLWTINADRVRNQATRWKIEAESET